MDDNALTDAVRQRIGELTVDDPLTALQLAGALQEEIDTLRTEAVRVAAGRHSWTEIGAALRVSKQAAHQKYVRSMADALRAEQRAEKAGNRAGQTDQARAARSRRDAIAAELRRTGRRA